MQSWAWIALVIFIIAMVIMIVLWVEYNSKKESVYKTWAIVLTVVTALAFVVFIIGLLIPKKVKAPMTTSDTINQLLKAE